MAELLSKLNALCIYGTTIYILQEPTYNLRIINEIIKLYFT